MRLRSLFFASLICLIVAGCLVLSACPVTPEDAAKGVVRYAQTLQTFEKSEIKLHETLKADGKPLISDEEHYKIIGAEKLALDAGRGLNKAIDIQAAGGDSKAYIDLAQKSFDDLVTTLDVGDADTKQALHLSAQLVKTALANVIVIVQSVQGKKPVPVSNQQEHPLLLWSSLFLPLMAAGAAGSGVLATIALILQIFSSLEPEAVKLALAFATSLKGKSKEELQAMSNQIFDEVDADLQAELLKKNLVVRP